MGSLDRPTPRYSFHSRSTLRRKERPAFASLPYIVHIVQLQIFFRKRLHQLRIVLGKIDRIIVQPDFGLLNESLDYLLLGRDVLELVVQVKLNELSLQTPLVEDMGTVEVVEDVAENVLVANIALFIDIEDVKLLVETFIFASQVIGYFLVFR